MISVPEFVASDYEMRLHWADEGVRILLDRFYESRGELTCEMVIDQVSTGDGPAGRLYGPAKVNLIADRTLTILGNKLQPRLNIDWDGLFTQLKALAIRQYREGTPLVDLSTVDVSGEAPRFLLPPFIDQHGVSVIVADGGTGKSLTALGMAVAVATCEPVFGDAPNAIGPVLYLDWEADEFTHAERLRAITRGLEIEMPTGMLHYQRMVSSMHESVASIRKKVLQVEAALVVIDSTGMARGGAPESAEETIRLFGALRALDVPILAIDHISKESKRNDQSAGVDPIGSVYTRNSARLVWSMEGGQQEGRGETVIVFRNSKANFGRKEPQRAFRYVFEEAPGGRLGAVRFEPVDWRDTEEFADRISAKDKIVRALRKGRLSVKDLSAEAGVSDAQVRARLADLKRSGLVMQFGSEWGLMADPRDVA